MGWSAGGCCGIRMGHGILIGGSSQSDGVMDEDECAMDIFDGWRLGFYRVREDLHTLTMR